jgi:hypothetical protein
MAIENRKLSMWRIGGKRKLAVKQKASKTPKESSAAETSMKSFWRNMQPIMKAGGRRRSLSASRRRNQPAAGSESLHGEPRRQPALKAKSVAAIENNGAGETIHVKVKAIINEE